MQILVITQKLPEQLKSKENFFQILEEKKQEAKNALKDIQKKQTFESGSVRTPDENEKKRKEKDFIIFHVLQSLMKTHPDKIPERYKNHPIYNALNEISPERIVFMYHAYIPAPEDLKNVDLRYKELFMETYISPEILDLTRAFKDNQR
ncbi:MAG: hypothetical protein JXQ74_03720 [Alphaproteobacteria bacterium]|nr:hypothetical protein [Alphaproteobacteria bacterium]